MIDPLSLDLLLPDAARIDLAYTETVDTPAFITGLVPWEYDTSSGYFELVLGLFVVITTDPTVGDRIITLAWLDETGAEIVKVPSAFLQPANTNIRYSFTIDMGYARSATPTVAADSIPLIVLHPNHTLMLSIEGASNINDEITAVRVTRLKIPNGPRLATLSPFSAPLDPRLIAA